MLVAFCSVETVFTRILKVLADISLRVSVIPFFSICTVNLYIITEKHCVKAEQEKMPLQFQHKVCLKCWPDKFSFVYKLKKTTVMIIASTL